MKPFKLPRWATLAGNILEPTEGEKDTGWPAGFKPPASFQNWLDDQVYKWFRYVGGVPSGNLIFRKADPVTHDRPPPSENDNIRLLDVIPNLGALKQIGSGAPADRFDEWWLATEGSAAPGNCRLWRFPSGLSNRSEGIPTGGGVLVGNGSGNYPTRIIWDGAKYVMCGYDGTTIAVETSVDGVTWINLSTIGVAERPLDMVWNGSLFMIIASNDDVHTSVDGITWIAQGDVTGITTVIAFAWSSVLSLWCAVGAGTVKASTSSDGGSWTAQATPAGSAALTGVIARDDGLFLAVGSEGSTPAVPVIWIGPFTSTFLAVAILPNAIGGLFNVIAIGTGSNQRLVATCEESNGSITDQATSIATYESYQAGLTGTWKRSGTLISPLPEDHNRASLISHHLMAASDDELAFVATIDGGAASSIEVLISELSHPNAD